MSDELVAWRDPDYEANRGEGVGEAWAAAAAALPRDAWIFHLAADSFPGGWEAFAHAERNGWTRTWVGRGSNPAAALRDLADYATKYPKPDPDPIP